MGSKRYIREKRLPARREKLRKRSRLIKRKLRWCRGCGISVFKNSRKWCPGFSNWCQMCCQTWHCSPAIERQCTVCIAKMPILTCVNGCCETYVAVMHGTQELEKRCFCDPTDRLEGNPTNEFYASHCDLRGRAACHGCRTMCYSIFHDQPEIEDDDVMSKGPFYCVSCSFFNPSVWSDYKSTVNCAPFWYTFSGIKPYRDPTIVLS